MSDRVSNKVLSNIAKALESGAGYHIVGGDMVRFEARSIVAELQHARAQLAAVAAFIADLRKPNEAWGSGRVGPFIAQEIENRLDAACGGES